MDIVRERTHCNLTRLMSNYHPPPPPPANEETGNDDANGGNAGNGNGVGVGVGGNLLPSFGEEDRRRLGPLPRRAFPGFLRYTTCREDAAVTASRWRAELDAESKARVEDKDGACAELIRRLGYDS